MAFWPADGNTSDVQGGHHAALAGGAGFGPGFVGEAFQLDGVGGGQDDHVDLPPAVLEGLVDVTVEGWVLTGDTDAAILSAANGDPGVGDNEILIYQGTTGLQQLVKQQSSGALPAFVADGAWHHVAFVREGATGRLYVDGAMVDERDYPPGPLAVAAGGLLLGQEQDCLGGCFDPNQAMDGMVDELAVYGRALASEEIAAIFDAGEAGKCQPVTLPDALARIDDLEASLDALTERVAELEAGPGNGDGGGNGDDNGSQCRDGHGKHGPPYGWHGGHGH